MPGPPAFLPVRIALLERDLTITDAARLMGRGRAAVSASLRGLTCAAPSSRWVAPGTQLLGKEEAGWATGRAD
jgi:hypothetical protein